MKKYLTVISLVLLITTMAFSVRLGVQLQNFNGYVNGQYLQGVRVSQTAMGYPAYGHLFPGDIITEAIMLPNSQIWSNPNNPNEGTLISFNPYYSLNQQLGQLGQFNYQYNYTQAYNYSAMLNFINSAPFLSNIILRLYRAQWNSWTLISIVLDSAGQGSIWAMPQPQQPVVQVNPNQPQVQINPNFQVRIRLRF